MGPDFAAASVHTFADASLGVTSGSLRSVSGVIVFMYGMPAAWKSKMRTVSTSSSTAAEWIPMSDAIELEESLYSVAGFFNGSKVKRVPLWRDNRSAVLSARKGIDGTEEIQRRARRVASRFAQVLPEYLRIFFTPTKAQLADGITKSMNPQALRNIFDLQALDCVPFCTLVARFNF